MKHPPAEGLMRPEVEVVASYGQTLDEATVKKGLLELSPLFTFDVLGNVGQWHPDIEVAQGVFHGGKHVCTMDRGHIEEWPVWSMSRECLEIQEHEVRPGEISLYIPCAACKGRGSIGLEAPLLRCGACDGTGRSGVCHVIRKIRDKCLRVGWQHTFRRIILHPVHGVTEASIERQFRINLIRDEDLGARNVDEIEEAKMVVRA